MSVEATTRADLRQGQDGRVGTFYADEAVVNSTLPRGLHTQWRTPSRATFDEGGLTRSSTIKSARRISHPDRKHIYSRVRYTMPSRTRPQAATRPHPHTLKETGNTWCTAKRAQAFVYIISRERQNAPRARTPSMNQQAPYSELSPACALCILVATCSSRGKLTPLHRNECLNRRMRVYFSNL